MLTARLILERFSKDGVLLERREKPSRSFLFQFIELLYCASAQITQIAPYTMTDRTGAARTVDSQTSAGAPARGAKANFMIGAAPGNASVICLPGEPEPYPNNIELEGQYIGIQVGTGVGAVTPTDFAMGTRIAHGRAGGELEYGGCELIGITIADPNGEFTIRRYFTNASGGGITVQEVGINAVGTDQGTTPSNCFSWPFCVARDLTGGVAVANTELLRVTYVVQITV